MSKRKSVRIMKRIGLLCLFSIVCFASIILYKEISYIPSPILIPDGMEIQSNVLGHYYRDYSQRYSNISKKYIFDRNGVPTYHLKGNCYYHPVRISQYALGAFEYFLDTGNNDAKNAFLTCAEWLTNNLRKHGKFFYWEYRFGHTDVPWFSAMAQGQGASVLLRAFSETHDKKYLHSARKAIEPIAHDISQGGVSVLKENTYLFPQEYSTNSPSEVLNGAISAWFGVYDYYRATGDSEVEQFCEGIMNTFLWCIEEYDTSYWSLYCRSPKYLASPYYNSVHVCQLKILYLISGEKKFLKYSKRFETYQSNWINRTKYVLANHLRQIKEHEFSDIYKLPSFLKETLFRR
ncbi:MAG: hypothetical protein HWN68_00785 [Desulfobacterales bacterium]|nr:hypothetical protein [Desulfobacterales bacterium]